LRKLKVRVDPSRSSAPEVDDHVADLGLVGLELLGSHVEDQFAVRDIGIDFVLLVAITIELECIVFGANVVLFGRAVIIPDRVCGSSAASSVIVGPSAVGNERLLVGYSHVEGLVSYLLLGRNDRLYDGGHEVLVVDKVSRDVVGAGVTAARNIGAARCG
jgi:hypothetical protein